MCKLTTFFMAQELTCSFSKLKPEKLMIELPMADKVDLTGVANLEKVVINIMANLINK